MSLSPNVAAALETQATLELAAAQNYLAMSCWCEVQQYDGFARFFRKQAAEEREHAERLLKHLTDRDVVPHLGAIAAPNIAFKGLMSVAQAAYDLERANTRGIHQAYEAALAEKDYPAQVLLHWFISEQVEEEAWSDKLIAKIRDAGCSGALLSLDRHLEKILGGDSGAD
ncbi:MAG: ferritin [Verrucomicrobiales bacterium]|nr:ferritin [Verrucomicrobiales bacterium]